MIRTDRDVLESLVRAMERFRLTPIVDDDFPTLRNEADATLRMAREHLSSKPTPEETLVKEVSQVIDEFKEAVDSRAARRGSGLFEVPNLDDLTSDPDEMRTVAEVFRHLAAYATLKSKAMRFRKDGKIQQAMAREAICKVFCDMLPEWARW